MSNLLKTGERWLADKMTRFASERVTYSRNDSDVYLSATIGRSEFDVEDASGGLLRVESRDFIINIASLRLDGVAVVPQSGDRITDNGFIYEVSSPGPGIHHFRKAGEYRARYRIHTKLVGEVP